MYLGRHPNFRIELMDILTPGKEPKKWVLEVVCSGWGHSAEGCGAVLRVHQEDLYQTDSPSNGLFVDFDTYITFRCCSCGVETDLTDNDKPCDWPNLPTRDAWLKNRKRSKNENT